MNELYLDNAATTKVYPEVIETITKSLEEDYYNPSSFYQSSTKVEEKLHKAKAQVADALNVTPEELIFTSGATESNNTIINSVVKKGRKDFNIITSSVEHPSVMKVFKDFENKGVDVRYIPVDEKGNLDLDWLKENIDEKTILLSVMAVNNELGTIMDLASVKKIRDKKAPKCVFHVDYVQAFLKSTDKRIDLKKIRPDAVSVSAHKVHGPKGVGALTFKKGLKLQPLVLGGGQEKGLRSGTENTASILGFSKAVEILDPKKKEIESHLRELTDYLISEIEKIEDAQVNTPSDGLPGLVNASFKDIKSEILLHMLDKKGILISAGSACSTHVKDSYVHGAIGLQPQYSQGTIRVSMDETTTKEDIDFFVENLKTGIAEIRKLTKRN